MNQLFGTEFSISLPKLQEVYITMEDETNPIFKDSANYASVVSKLTIAPNLQV